MNLADYDKKYKTQLVTDVKRLKDKAHRLKAFEGEQRLKLIEEHFSKLSLEQAYLLLNPEAFRREVEEVLAYKRRHKFALFLRIAFGLAPLIVTWSSLSWAVLEYGNYVSVHRQDQNQILSFLQLWQNGSLSGLTFFWTGVIDVGLLLLFLITSLYSLRLEYWARTEAEEFAEDLQKVATELMEAVVKEGPSAGLSSLSDADLTRIMVIMKGVIEEAFQDLGELVDKAKDSIIMVGKETQDLFDQQIKPMLSNFDDKVNKFHDDLDNLNSKVKELVNASNAMAVSARDMAGSASSMAGSVSSLATNVREQTQISKDIDAHLVQLNTTEGQVMQVIDTTQRAVASEVNRAAVKVEASASKLETAVVKIEEVGRQLTTINPQNVQRIIDNARIFADRAEQVATELQKAAMAISSPKPPPPSPKAPPRPKPPPTPWWKRILR